MQHIKPIRRRVFDYLDFREFLRDCYQAKKEENRAFSYRYIAAKVGLDSGAISRILSGERNLHPEMARSLAAVFGLDEPEKEYFEILVLFGQAKSLTEKNPFLERIFRLRGTKVSALEERQYVFYRKWYHLALRELLNFHPFEGDYNKLARMLRPAITTAEARRAIRLLLDIGLLERDEKGKLRVTEALITSGDGIRAVYMNNLHLTMAELAARAFPSLEPRERDFSGLTFGLSAQGFAKVQAKTKEFRRELLEIVKHDQGADCVYRMNLQLFPVSIPQGKGAP